MVLSQELHQAFARSAEIAAHYQMSTGIACRILTREELEESKGDFCFCRIAQDKRSKRTVPLCGRTHLHNARQAERFGGSFIYFCTSYLLYWSSPIMHDGAMIGTFIAGPALMVSSDEVLEEWRKIYPGVVEEELLAYLEEIPVITPERSRSLAELLLMSAGWVGENGNRQLLAGSDYLKQQAKISEYIHEIKGAGNSGTASSYPIEKEEELLTAIARGNRDQAQRILNEILGSVFFASGKNFEIIKFRILEIIILLSRASIDGGADPDEILSMNYRYLKEIEQFRNADSLAYWLSEVLNQFAAEVFNLEDAKHVNRLERTLHFINSHYTEKISLEDAASYAALSPAYFSKIFKEEMNCSFTQYINWIRIDHAKTLLRTTPCTLVEVAGLVGFEDQSYFSRVFKNVAGVSPGRYRENSHRFNRNTHEIHESNSGASSPT